MNIWDIVIVVLIVLAAVLAFLKIRDNKKKGKTSCGGDCAGCGCQCGKKYGK